MALQKLLYAKEDRLLRKRPGERVDIPFLLLLLVLLCVGLVMLYSASFAQSQYDTGYTQSTRYLQKQGLCALIGLGAMVILSRIPPEFWLKWAWVLYGVSIVLLLSVLLFGESVNGARRWINIAGIQFQPSEIAKFTLIVLFAKLTRDFGKKAREFKKGVLGFGAALLGILVPLALEKHLSAIMLMGMVAVVMMYVAGTHPKWLLAGAGAAIVFVVVYVSLMGYAGDRITAWRHPEQDPSDTGYQILQSLYAIGSGGLFGLGLGRSRQKYLYLPFQYNDYIFAIICEELGLFGACLLIFLFGILIWRLMVVASHTRDLYGCLIVVGIMAHLMIQVILNIAVVTNTIPNTGITLPFVSYGGTSVLFLLSEIGIALNVSLYIRKEH